MKKMKKLVWIVLGCVMALSTVSCKGGGAKTQGVDDNTIHYVEGTLHKVNVSEGYTPFVVNGQTEYEIFVDLSNSTMKAAINKSAGFVAEHVENATGAKLTINTEKPDGLSKSDYAIVYGYPDLFAELGLTMPSDDIGTTGYYIKTCGNVVFLQANGSDGYEKMIEYFSFIPSARVILTDLFWHSKEIDETIYHVGKKKSYEVVHIGDLGEQEENMAIGQFWHSGVAGHPNDVGMKRIAERIVEKI